MRCAGFLIVFLFFSKYAPVAKVLKIKGGKMSKRFSSAEEARLMCLARHQLSTWVLSLALALLDFTTFLFILFIFLRKKIIKIQIYIYIYNADTQVPNEIIKVTVVNRYYHVTRVWLC